MGIIRYNVNGTIFEIDEDCYGLKYAIGHGAYGTVCSAVDVKTDQKVAIKKVSNAFVEVETRRILREIKLLRHYNHENIIALRDIIKPPSYEEFKDIYIVTDLMDTDLHQIVKSDQPLTDQHVQYFMYQILKGLKCIHSANVLHRDLKPSNILLNANCDLKICDFGLARGKTMSDMTDYVATRWYRAPELIMQSRNYGKPIDIWSVGCILCELITRKPLFPGRDYIDQLHKIIDVVGTPTAEDLQDMGSEQARRYVLNMAKRPRVRLATKLPNASPLAVDLVEKMLQFNPAARITVEQSLAHPYFEEIRDENNEPVCDSVFDFSFEKRAKTKEDIKEMIYQEMLYFHPEAAEEHRLRSQQLQAAKQLENQDEGSTDEDMDEYDNGQDVSSSSSNNNNRNGNLESPIFLDESAEHDIDFSDDEDNIMTV